MNLTVVLADRSDAITAINYVQQTMPRYPAEGIAHTSEGESVIDEHELRHVSSSGDREHMGGLGSHRCASGSRSRAGRAICGERACDGAAPGSKRRASLPRREFVSFPSGPQRRDPKHEVRLECT